MPLSTAGKNAAAGGAASQVGFVSLHTAVPDASGSAEVSGGTPAYARKAVAWNLPATNGVVAVNAGVTFDVPGGVQVSNVGLWTAATGGTFLGSAPLSAAETYGGQGTYNLTALTITIT